MIRIQFPFQPQRIVHHDFASEENDRKLIAECPGLDRVLVRQSGRSLRDPAGRAISARDRQQFPSLPRAVPIPFVRTTPQTAEKLFSIGIAVWR
jgi:hypothetical protein